MTATPEGSGHPLHRRRDVMLLVAPVAIYLLVFSLFPLLYSLAISFFRWDQIASTFHFIGLQNFQELFSDAVFWQASINTAILVVAGVAIQLFVGTALAIFFDRQLRGSWIVRGVLILPMLLTPVVVGLMWRAMLNPDWGMVNYVLGELGLPEPLWLGDPSLALFTLIIVDSWQWVPFILVIVFARLQALPREPFEAASVDGASSWQAFWRLTLPLLMPAIVFAGIFRAIDAFRSFDVVFGLTFGGPGRLTTTLSFYAWENSLRFDRYGFASAISWVMVVVAIIGVTLLFRYLKVRRDDAT
jgi:multiple sugar transport system permease protein